MTRIPDELLASLGERISRAADPTTDDAITQAEGLLGRSIPEDLLQIYRLADGNWGPGDGIMPLATAVANYLKLRSEPFGPLDQPWPENLLPLYEEDRVPVCLDLVTGKIVAWEADRIEDMDNPDDFEESFVAEAASLAELLSNWLGSETFEQMRERTWRETMAHAEARGVSPVTGFPNQFDDPNERAEGEIEFLASLPDLRADFGLPDAGWEAEIRRRHGIVD